MSYLSKHMKGISMYGDGERKEHNKNARKTEGPRVLQFGRKIVNKVKQKFNEVKDNLKANKEQKAKSQKAFDNMKEKGLLKYGK
tara:strand:+ start:1282 stop:1533 length:252 start_codon:yes stop_codon:yes gene_type:complete